MLYITYLRQKNMFILGVPVSKTGKNDSGQAYHFNGAVSATNNGISLIPTFSLGKPATIIELNAGGEHLTFEPQFRISLEGQPGHLASQRLPISTISLKNTFRYRPSGIKIQVYNNYFCTMLSVRPKCKNPSLHVGMYVF